MSERRRWRSIVLLSAAGFFLAVSGVRALDVGGGGPGTTTTDDCVSPDDATGIGGGVSYLTSGGGGGTPGAPQVPGGAGSLGRFATDPLVGLVDPGGGSVLESAIDLAMPSKGAAVVRWRHMRTYDQRSGGPGDTVQGQNWFHAYLQNLQLSDTGTDDTKAVVWRADAHRAYTFPNTGSWAYGPSDSTLAVLTRNHAGDPSNTFRVELLDGALLLFHSFDAGVNSNERGKLRAIRDVYGNELAVTYQSGNTGKIDYITDPSGHYFRYSYVSGGDNDGRLDYIRVFKSSGTTDADLIARIEFTYKSSTDSLDSGCGTAGDLVKVLAKTHKSGETGTTFSIVRTTHYRYWKNADSQGDDHQLKMILRPEHFQRADDALTDPLTATDAQVDDYATWLFEFDSNARASKMTVAAGGSSCGGCGGGGGPDAGAYEFTYDTQSSSTRNDWAVRAKVELKSGSNVMWTRYLDCNNWGEVYKDVLLTNDSDHTKPLWGMQYDRDSSGRVTTYYTPSAISDYTASTHAFTYVNDGQVLDYTYDSSAKFMATMRLRKYSEAGTAARYLGKWEYAATQSGTDFGLRTRYLLDKSHAYPSESTSDNPSDRITTDYDYVYYVESDSGIGDRDGDSGTTDTTDLIKVVRIKYPTVTTTQNGPNVDTYEYRYLDALGRVRWIKDAEGAVHYQSYHDLTGALTYSVRDVYPGASEAAILPSGITSPDQDGGADIWADWTGAAPKDMSAGLPFTYDFQTTPSSPAKLQNKRLMDLRGRISRTTAPDGMLIYYIYLDGETRNYVAWNATTDKPLLPVRRVLSDRDGRTTEVIEVDPSTITFSDPPDGTEDLSNQSKWVAWVKTTYDSNLRRSTVDAYHTIPATGSGSSGTNYYRTTYTYGEDTTNRLHWVQVKDPESGYTKTYTNARGQRTKVEGTAVESGGSPTSWKTLTEYFYDQAAPGTGDSKGGNGNLTQVKRYYGDSSSNSTSFTYDWRGRQIFNGTPDGPKTLNKYDNLNRVVASGQYSNGTTLSVSDDPTATTSTGRLALRETFYNNRGQVYQAKQWEILASNGNKDASLVTDTYNDRVGRTVAVKSPGGGARVTKYNGAGQTVETQTCSSLGSTLYNAGGDFDYGSDNKPVELAQTTYDSGGRPTEIKRFELKAKATGAINPSSPGTNGMEFKQRHYYDAAGRRTQTTEFGTFANGGLAGPMNGSKKSVSSYDPGSTESASDIDLVTKWTYSSAGRLDKITDPDSKENKYEYDALGRRTAMIEDNTGLARRTEYQYNGNSDIIKLIAKNVGGTDQQTEYYYGTSATSGRVSSRWVLEIRYPDPSTGQPSTASADKVVFTYNHDGTVATRTDQNGGVLSYDYDSLRRKTHERVTTLGSGVDGAVRRISTTYTALGQVEKLTSYDNATVGSGSVVNEVKYTFNGLSQLTKDEQEHGGAVGGSTLNVQYAWTESTANNHSRLDNFTYPNGRDLFAKYTHSAAGTTWQDETADAFSRVAQFAESSGSPGDVYVEYTFAGLSRMTERASDEATGYKGNDTTLNLDSGTQDEYAGLDFAGRAIAQKTHTVGSGTTVQTSVEYRSNRDGSPKFAEPQSKQVLGRSNLYSYDGLHRLSQADTGTLNSGRTDILTEWSDPGQLIYTMDILGNFTSIDRKNSGVSASETRSHNATNELTSRTVTGESARYWVNDPFTDNNTTGWAVANLNTGSSGEAWAASGGTLACTGVETVSGAPDGGQGSAILIDKAYYQDIRITCSTTLQSGADNAGIVFGYKDANNFWVKLYSKATQTIRVYQISGGTWTQQNSSSTTITAGTAFTMAANVRAGNAGGYGATVPAGQVGLWCDTGSGNSFDDFVVEDIAGPFEVDGRWVSDVGGAKVDSSDSNVLSIDTTTNTHVPVMRRGVRADKYVLTCKFKADSGTRPGILVRYLSPSDWLAVWLNLTVDNKAWLTRRKDDDGGTTLTSSATALSLTNGTWYTAKVLVDDDTGNSALQRLRFWVDTDNDGDFSDETTLIDTTVVDDDWSGGYVGVYRGTAVTAVTQFDDFKLGIDNSSPKDGDFADAGDEIVVDDNFNSAAISLSYDNNGNLTDDGIFKFVYDAWNRLAQVTHRSAANAAAIATYAYDGANRRTKKVVANQGPEATPNDGGNTTIHFYYDSQWRIVEERNGSNQTIRQYLWGTRYVDELVWMEVNGDPTIGNDTDPDVTASGESSETPTDMRYFVHQDRNWNVVAITEYDPNKTNNGRVVERYTYDPYGGYSTVGGIVSGSESGAILSVSLVGNVFAHKGHPLDHEKHSYNVRSRGRTPAREYRAELQRFGQRYADERPSTQRRRATMNLYSATGAATLVAIVDGCTPWEGVWGRCCGTDEAHQCHQAGSQNDGSCLDQACENHDECTSRVPGCIRFPGFPDFWECNCQMVDDINECLRSGAEGGEDGTPPGSDEADQANELKEWMCALSAWTCAGCGNPR